MRSPRSAPARPAPRDELSALELPIGRDARLDAGDAPARGGDRFWSVCIDDADHDIVKVRGVGAAPEWLARGTTMRLSFADGTSVTAVQARVLEVQHDRVRLALVGTVSKVQRRSHCRIPIVEPVAVAVHQPGAPAQQMTMRLRDLSAGGCCLQAPCLIRGGTRVSVRLSLGGTPVQVPGEVIGSARSGGSTRIGVKFDPLPSTLDAALVRFVFEQQRRSAARRGREA